LKATKNVVIAGILVKILDILLSILESVHIVIFGLAQVDLFLHFYIFFLVTVVEGAVTSGLA